MKAVLLHVPEEELVRRRKLGIDRWDEVWEGVLHMAPAPDYEHQRMQTELCAFLSMLLKRTGRGAIVTSINVFDDASPKENYRIPDLVFIARGHENIIAKAGTRGGGPDAVIEIRSPDDETYEKMEFYAGIGVREFIVVDRDSKKPEIYRLAGRRYVAVAPDEQGKLFSETLGVKFTRIDGNPPKLLVEDAEDSSVRAEI